MSQAPSQTSAADIADSTYEDLKQSLEKLQQYEAELLKEISSINESFVKLGIPSTVLKDEGVQKSVDPFKAAGIVMRSQLSFRGKDKAKEYFRFVDLDGDDLINYADLRAVHAFGDPLGSISSVAFQSKAAWLASMHDGGYPLVDNELLPLSSFLKHRTNIEHRQSIAFELTALRLGLLPKELVHWNKIKQSCRQLFAWRVERRSHSREEMTRLADRLVFEEMQFLANRLGLHFTAPELTLLLLGVYNKRKVNAQLLRVYSRLHLSEDDYSFQVNSNGRLVVNREEEKALFADLTEFVAAELQEVPVPEFTAWALSCPLLINMKSAYRRLLAWKYSFIDFMRHVDSYSRWIFMLGAHLNDRLVFRDFPPLSRLLRRLQQICTYKCVWSVNAGSSAGDAGSSLQGLGLNLKLMRVDNVEATVKKLGAPPGSATVIYFDLLVKDEQDEAAVSKKGKSGQAKSAAKPPAVAEADALPTELSAADAELTALVRLIHLFLQHHFEKELKGSNSYLNNLQVYLTTNELDDSKVIRVMVSYKKLVNVDKFLEYLVIPYKLNEVVNVFTADLRTNVDLQDLCTHNKLQSLNETLSCTLSTTLSLRKNILAALAERLMLACCSGLSRDQAAAALAAAGAPKKAGSGASAASTNASTRTEDDDDLRKQRWQQLTPFYPKIAAASEAAFRFFASIKTGTYRFAFRNLGDLYQQLGIWTDFHSFTILPRAVVFEAGEVCKRFLQWTAAFKAEMGKLFVDLKTHLQDKKREEDAVAWRQLLLMHSPSKNAHDQSTSHAHDDMSIGSHTNVVQFMHEQALNLIHIQHKDQTEHDTLGLRMLEKLLKHTVGVHAVEAISGKNKLSALFQGCDVFELLHIASGGALLPGSMQEEYDKAHSKKRVFVAERT